MESLYEKIGGRRNIEKLVTAFYQNVLADPMLQPFFENSSIEKLERMQRAFFTIALGGPTPEEEVSIAAAHRGRGIERKHLTRFTEHLMATLKEVGIEEENAQQVYREIAMYSDEVLGESAEDG